MGCGKDPDGSGSPASLSTSSASSSAPSAAVLAARIEAARRRKEFQYRVDEVSFKLDHFSHFEQRSLKRKLLSILRRESRADLDEFERSLGAPQAQMNAPAPAPQVVVNLPALPVPTLFSIPPAPPIQISQPVTASIPIVPQVTTDAPAFSDDDTSDDDVSSIASSTEAESVDAASPSSKAAELVAQLSPSPTIDLTEHDEEIVANHILAIPVPFVDTKRPRSNRDIRRKKRTVTRKPKPASSLSFDHFVNSLNGFVSLVTSALGTIQDNHTHFNAKLEDMGCKVTEATVKIENIGESHAASSHDIKALGTMLATVANMASRSQEQLDSLEALVTSSSDSVVERMKEHDTALHEEQLRALKDGIRQVTDTIGKLSPRPGQFAEQPMIYGLNQTASNPMTPPIPFDAGPGNRFNLFGKRNHRHKHHDNDHDR